MVLKSGELISLKGFKNLFGKLFTLKKKEKSGEAEVPTH